MDVEYLRTITEENNVVCLVRDNRPGHDGEEAVCKIVRRLENDVNIRREILQHRRLTWSPYIPSFREVYFLPGCFCLLIDYVGEENLHDYVLNNHCLPEDRARWYTQQIVTTLDYTHKMGVCNRDVKLNNYVIRNPISDPPVLMQVDLGCCKSDTSATPISLEGTPSYMAPEVARCGGPFARKYEGKKADMFSMAICIVRMLFGVDSPVELDPELPAGILPEDAGMNTWKIPDSSLRDAQGLPQISEICFDFLMRLLQNNPVNRMDMDGVWNHPWFQINLLPGLREANDNLIQKQAELEANAPNDLKSIDEVRQLLQGPH